MMYVTYPLSLRNVENLPAVPGYRPAALAEWKSLAAQPGRPALVAPC